MNRVCELIITRKCQETEIFSLMVAEALIEYAKYIKEENSRNGLGSSGEFFTDNDIKISWEAWTEKDSATSVAATQIYTGITDEFDQP